MKKRKWVLLALATAMISVSWGTVQVRREPNRKGLNDQSLSARQERVLRSRVTTAQRRSAAARFKQLRQNQLSQTLASGARMSVMAAPAPDPGGVPHYFGPYPNYANSPLPAGRVGPITVAAAASGYTNPTVVITDLYGIGTGATAQAVLNGTGIGAVNVTSPGTNYYAPLVLITDPTGAGADVTASLVGPFTGGLHKFIDRSPVSTRPIRTDSVSTSPWAFPIQAPSRAATIMRSSSASTRNSCTPNSSRPFSGVIGKPIRTTPR